MAERLDSGHKTQQQYEDILSHLCEGYEISRRVDNDELQHQMVEACERAIEMAENTRGVALPEEYYLAIGHYPPERD